LALEAAGCPTERHALSEMAASSSALIPVLRRLVDNSGPEA
jgi:hypothetical protein